VASGSEGGYCEGVLGGGGRREQRRQGGFVPWSLHNGKLGTFPGLFGFRNLLHFLNFDAPTFPKRCEHVWIVVAVGTSASRNATGAVL